MAHHDHNHRHHDHDTHLDGHQMSIFQHKLMLPVLIIALTLALMTTFQMRQILTERKLIKQAYEGQEQALGQVKQVNQQFESLAVGTARLAQGGDATAQGIVADLRRLGITINPNAKENEKAIEQGQPQPETTAAPLATPPAASDTPAAPAAPAAQ